MSSLLLRCATLLLGLAAFADAAALTRVTSPNGRKVLEIRTGTQPNTGLLRTLVVTAGPIAQTTSLMVNTAFVSDIFGPNPPPMTWTVLVSSGTLFSLGGGCSRGNQVDFPYINNNKLAIARFVGTTSTIITATINSAANYESVNCVVSPDGQSTMYVLVNSTARRTEIWKQNINNVFTLQRQFNLEARLPFNGAIRPTIGRMLRSTLPGKIDHPSKAVPSLFFEDNRYLVVDQIASSTIRSQIWDDQAGVLTLVLGLAGNPSSLPPQDPFQAGECWLLDRDGNGVVDMSAIGNNHCYKPTNPTSSLGSAGGQNTYSYTGTAAVHSARRKLTRVFNSARNRISLTTVTSTASPHAGTDGPFSACTIPRTFRSKHKAVVLGPQPGSPTSVLFSQEDTPHPDYIFSDGNEDGLPPGESQSLHCDPIDIFEEPDPPV